MPPPPPPPPPLPPCGTCEQCLKKACKAGAFAKSEHGYNKCLHCTSGIACTKVFPGPGPPVVPPDHQHYYYCAGPASSIRVCVLWINIHYDPKPAILARPHNHVSSSSAYNKLSSTCACN